MVPWTLDHCFFALSVLSFLFVVFHCIYTRVCTLLFFATTSWWIKIYNISPLMSMSCWVSLTMTVDRIARPSDRKRHTWLRRCGDVCRRRPHNTHTRDGDAVGTCVVDVLITHTWLRRCWDVCYRRPHNTHTRDGDVVETSVVDVLIIHWHVSETLWGMCC